MPQKPMTSSVIASLSLSTLLLIQPVIAADTTTHAEMEDPATINNFDDLSPGNQMIARSLMDAQTLPPDSEIQPWSLDDIAAAQAETGWGNVFKQMQAEGLIEARNLGQVVSGHARATHQPVPEGIALESQAQATESGPEQQTETTADTGTPENIDGTFENLSPGNKKIARALMDAQTLPPDSTTQPWSLDQIAAAKGTTGWGNVFKQMQSEGLVETKNLGQVVSQYQHNSHTIDVTATGASTAVATTATTSGQLPDQANGKAVGHNTDMETAAAATGNPGITTASGTAANGNAYGLSKHAVSASDGITTAGGATITAGNNAAVNTGAGSNNAAAVATNTNAVSHSAAAASASTAAGGTAGNGNGFAYGRSE